MTTPIPSTDELIKSLNSLDRDILFEAYIQVKARLQGRLDVLELLVKGFITDKLDLKEEIAKIKEVLK